MSNHPTFMTVKTEKMKNPAGWQDFFAGIDIFFENSALFSSFLALEVLELVKTDELGGGAGERQKDGGVAGGQRRISIPVSRSSSSSLQFNGGASRVGQSPAVCLEISGNSRDFNQNARYLVSTRLSSGGSDAIATTRGGKPLKSQRLTACGGVRLDWLD